MRAALIFVAVVGCSSTDASEGSSANASELEPRCSDVDAFRVDSETCLVQVRTSMRACVPGGDEQHWGVINKCSLSPTGELHVVTLSMGAEVSGDEGWVDVGADAGAVMDACLVALQARRECEW